MLYHAQNLSQDTLTGLKHLKTLADFTKENGAVHCDVGAIQTGANAGSLIAAMFVEKMATIENIFDHFQIKSFIKKATR